MIRVGLGVESRTTGPQPQTSLNVVANSAGDDCVGVLAYNLSPAT
jgi:hypothetical protein